MVMLLSKLLFLLFSCAILLVSCSLYGQNVAVSDTFTDGTGSAFRSAYLHFQLNNCGANFPNYHKQASEMGFLSLVPARWEEIVARWSTITAAE
jgi:hypothetical protein